MSRVKMKYVFLIGCMVVIVLLILWNYSRGHKPNVIQTQKSKRDEYYQRIQLAQAQLQKQRVDRRKALKKLGELYRDGVPDRYDLHGHKIKGIEPNASKALQHFQEAHRLGCVYSMFKIAKIYHYGMHEFDPDLEKAIEAYRTVLKVCPNDIIRNKADDSLKELQTELATQRTHRWLNLPYSPPKSDRYKFSQSNPVDAFLSSLPANSHTTLTDATMRRSGPSRATQPVTNNNTAENDEETVPDHMKNDRHNVHDSGVLGTIRKAIDNIQRETKTKITLDQTLTQIRDFLVQDRTKIPNDKRNDAIRALDAIERSWIPLSSTNIKEVDALHLVWNRIHDPRHEENRELLKSNLLDELSDCIEHGKPVCSTGRFTRILDTLNVVDPAVEIKPMYAIRSEMMSKCAKIRNELLSKIPETERIHIESGHDNEFVHNFTERLKNEIRKQLKLDYVDSGVLPQWKLDKELSIWVDHI